MHNTILENKMDNVIVNEYMARKYSAYTWVLKQGNNCVWVIMNNINMYFIIKDNKIKYSGVFMAVAQKTWSSLSWVQNISETPVWRSQDQRFYRRNSQRIWNSYLPQSAQ